MKLILKGVLLLCLSAVAVSQSCNSLGDWNVLSNGELTVWYTEIGGRAAGRTCSFNGSGFATDLSNTTATTVYCEDATATNSQVYHGNMETLNTPVTDESFNFLEGSLLPAASALDFSWATWENLADQYCAAEAVQADFNPTGFDNTIELVLYDTDFNLFKIQGDLMSGAVNLKISNTPDQCGATVVLQVLGAGNTVAWSGGFEADACFASKVVVVFCDAPEVLLGSAGSTMGIHIKASILAPRSTVTFTNGMMHGQMIAASLATDEGNHLAEFHNLPFDGCLRDVQGYQPSSTRDPIVNGVFIPAPGTDGQGTPADPNAPVCSNKIGFQNVDPAVFRLPLPESSDSRINCGAPIIGMGCNAANVDGITARYFNGSTWFDVSNLFYATAENHVMMRHYLSTELYNALLAAEKIELFVHCDNANGNAEDGCVEFSFEDGDYVTCPNNYGQGGDILLDEPAKLNGTCSWAYTTANSWLGGHYNCLQFTADVDVESWKFSYKVANSNVTVTGISQVRAWKQDGDLVVAYSVDIHNSHVPAGTLITNIDINANGHPDEISDFYLNDVSCGAPGTFVILSSSENGQESSGFTAGSALLAVGGVAAVVAAIGVIAKLSRKPKAVEMTRV